MKSRRNISFTSEAQHQGHSTLLPGSFLTQVTAVDIVHNGSVVAVPLGTAYLFLEVAVIAPDERDPLARVGGDIGRRLHVGTAAWGRRIHHQALRESSLLENYVNHHQMTFCETILAY